MRKGAWKKAAVRVRMLLETHTATDIIEALL